MTQTMWSKTRGYGSRLRLNQSRHRRHGSLQSPPGWPSTIFAYPLNEIAEIIERTPATTRQLAKRARDHVAAGRPRFAPDPADVEELTELLLAASVNGDIETLKSYLADDVVHISDGGPQYRAARAPIVGPHRVSRFFTNLAQRWEPGMEAHAVVANGQRALYITIDNEPFILLVLNWVDRLIASSYGVRNPDKLGQFHQAWLRGLDDASERGGTRRGDDSRLNP